MAERVKLERRRFRSRKNLKSCMKVPTPRLSVFRSNFHIYAQIIDDAKAVTVVAVSTNDVDMKSKIAKGWDVKAAELVGQAIGEKAKQAGIKKVVFDRGPYLYHGRIKALALGARSAGLEF